jgi:hypothetical protein
MVCRLRRAFGSVLGTTKSDSASTTRDGVGAQHSKEVARVISNKFQKTALTPSFGASAYGPASLEVRGVAAVAGVQVSTCARIRHIGGGMGLATKGDFPGTSAWRPPTC